ncbi:MAG: hypothetical protein HYX75_05620 [Acidobacteria bacterium]|nr:hypothetical protein [Acidobacteriota bacterium]
MKLFLAAVFIVFAGILVVVYAAARRANPVLLDEQGHPINVTSAHH